MPGTRSSARQAAAVSSNPASANPETAGNKRKRDSAPGNKSKRGRKVNGKQQTTIEASMPTEGNEGGSQDVDMKDDEAPSNEEVTQANESIGEKDRKNVEERENAVKEREDAVNEKENAVKTDSTQSKGDGNGAEEATSTADVGPDGHDGDSSKMDEANDNKAQEDVASAKNGAPLKTDDAVEESSKREDSTPSSILEKGIIYFFFRGRVGIDEPSNVDDVARSYIVLRPLPHGSKLGDGPIGDAGTNRLLALPKKVLPTSPKDRFMIFVEKANVSMDDIKSTFASSNYATKTAGTRHTPAATPIAEGIYAITTTGRESHLAYILTIPAELSEVQKDVGLQERGSFVTSAKNPQYSGPANARLPEGPAYPQKILDEFHSLRWTPLQPKLLDYENAQFLVIGNASRGLDEATKPQPGDDKKDKDTPLEEMEKLEHEDELRVNHLNGDDSVFDDLGLSSKDYPKVQTTW